MASSTDNPSNPTFVITFVCTGNICRSPMAEVICTSALEDEGLNHAIRANSCGTGGWHVGQGADSRAIDELRASGYDGTHHRASQLGEQHRSSDLLIALDSSHRNALLRMGYPAEKVRLLQSFNPDSHTPDVADPYYGTAADFKTTRRDIEAAMPGLMAWLQEAIHA